MAENRVAYAEMLQKVFNGDVSFSILKSEAAEKDKGFINMLFMTAFRQAAFIRNEVLPLFVKKKIPQKQRILEYFLLLGATELLFMETPDYAVINSYVEAAKAKTDKFGANFINAVLRNIARQKDRLLKTRQSGYFGKEFLCILKKDYTAQQIQEMESYADKEAPLDLTLKQGVKADQYNGVILPGGSIRLPPHTKVSSLLGYENGDFWVQDAAAALAVKTLGDIRGLSVLDLCAAPGGKTAQLLDAGAVVTAVEVSQTRLEILAANIKRLRLGSKLKCVCSDALLYTSDNLFDIVLVDAPCSATGTFRRHPEIMSIKTPADVKKMSRLQKDILAHSAKLVKKGGRLLYATCSLAKDEGERQIFSFLAAHPDFQIMPIEQENVSDIYTKEGFIRVLPQDFKEFGGADGFFIACLKRKV